MKIISQGIVFLVLCSSLTSPALGLKLKKKNKKNNKDKLQRALQTTTCPNQQPCHDFGRGLMGYSVSKVNPEDRSCQGYCAAGQSLARRLADGFECGPCQAPTCPNTQSCGMLGDSNDIPGYPVSRTTNGICEEFCAAGNSLIQRLQGGFACGACQASACASQPSCFDFGNGLLGYNVYSENQDGTCDQYCAAGSSLSRRIISGYQCGECPNPRCERDAPCDTFDGVDAFHVHRGSGKDCEQFCASGSSLVSRLNAGYTCGECPAIGAPSNCENAVQCGLINGNMGYSIHQVNTDGTCDGRCATGLTLIERLANGWSCGGCPEIRCPNEQPCADFDGTPGYPIFKYMDDGFCQGYCAAGLRLLERQNRDGFTCGPCPPASSDWARCPNAQPCEMFGTTPGYSIHRMTENGRNCEGYCAAGTALNNRLNNGFVCGDCPPPPECPNQTPCDDYNGTPGYQVYQNFPASGNLPAYCDGYCAGGASLQDRFDMGYTCGTCRR